MRYYYIVFITIVAAVLTVNKAAAQEEINQDVKVVKAYTPTVSDAFKVSYMPDLNDSSSFNPNFNYRILSTSVATNYQPAPIAAAKINTKRKEYLHKSYIKGGVGNYSSVFAELGYNILENEKYVLGLNVGHLTSMGDLTLEDDNTVDAPFNDTWAAADFKHFFDDKTLSVNLGFMHNKFQYYGYQTMTDGDMYWLPDGTLSPGVTFRQDKDQRLSGFSGSIGLSNNETDKRKTRYAIEGGFSTFGNMTGVSQLGIAVNGKLSKPINDLAFDINGGIESYSTSVPDTIGPMYTFKERNQTMIRVNPAINFKFDRANLRVGMQIAGIIDSEGDEFYLTPDVMGELTVVEGIASIYGGINGKVNMNDYQSMMNENAFASADINVKSSLYGLNFVAGIKGNFSSSMSFSAGMEYGLFNDEHFWVNKPYTGMEAPGGVQAIQHYSNVFDVVYDDGSLLKVAGELMYKPKQTIEFALNGAYYGWSLDNQADAWHMPEVELGLEGSFNLLDNLYATAGVKYLGERSALDASNATTSVKSLDGVVDVNLGTEYYFSKQWSFWLSMNNLAASKYYKWNGYPMQGFNAKAGVIFSF
ncbi:hypothetical protein J1N10_07075 [Carboxylicivirga sp. A043]|uniref:hypothetical protein n=1 Tax=Carboxylicivirga litoralis TaxID=2816963 RepID=UPI0021CB6E21|nr:hypothetical protein [Carboxylicivirga sp. A043]MCU4155734.1 hypothetical protein [Carboxylicivirga sp. A043]